MKIAAVRARRSNHTGNIANFVDVRQLGVGREHGKEMKSLAPNGTESTLIESGLPECKQGEEIIPFVMAKHKMELKQGCDEVKEHETNKAKSFLVVQGQ